MTNSQFFKIFIPIILVLLLGVGIFFYLLVKDDVIDTGSVDEVNITYWGIFMPEEVIAPLIEKYKTTNPNVNINYEEMSFGTNIQDYKNTLMTRLKNRGGPTMFRMHSSWTPSLYPEISRVNESTSVENFTNKFYEVSRRQCVTNAGEVVCIPLMYDGLALLYNKDMFADAGIQPPNTWEELRLAARRLTQRSSEDSRSRIVVSGVALGTTNNVSNASDILTILMLQNGVILPDELDTQDAQNAVRYYSSFANDRIWDESMPLSTNAFATQNAAMVFAKRWEILEILQLNPTLNFGVIPIPQVPKLDGTTTNDNWSSFWVESVSNDASKSEQQEAWKFLAWLSEADQQKMLFSEYSKYYKFGEVYSLPVLKNELLNTPYLGAYVEQAPTARTWVTAEYSGNDDYVAFMEAFINLGAGRLDEYTVLKNEFIEKLKEDGYR